MLANDKAALALLERVCLFRLGVEATTLSAIFINKSSGFSAFDHKKNHSSSSLIRKVFEIFLMSIIFLNYHLNSYGFNQIENWIFGDLSKKFFRNLSVSSSDVRATPGSDVDAKNGAISELANLSHQELQRKLDWLVRMRIIEATEIKSSGTGKARIFYNVHPAVRDGFVQGIGRDIATVSHRAIRTGLEISLGDVPGKNPSDPTTLDWLEEIIYHALASGQVQEAFDIYWFKIGKYSNLGQRLGAYERGERICRAFGGGQSPEKVATLLQEPRPLTTQSSPCMAFSTANRSLFINEWALYLLNLGRLDAAARCYEVGLDFDLQNNRLNFASISNQNLCQVWLLAGRLKLVTATAKKALYLADKVGKYEGQMNSCRWQGIAWDLRGVIRAALEDFAQCLHLQHQIETNATERPLYRSHGIQHTLLLTRLGRHEEAQRLTEANIEVMKQIWPDGESWTPQCQLILADLLLQKNRFKLSRQWHELSHNWALARDSKETLCWTALVKARIELAEIDVSRQESEISKRALQVAQKVLDEGVKIARDCGYGIYHIDLLLAQAHLHLLQGNPQAALADLRLALDDGIPANDRTGQPQLLAANDPECGYAWGIVEGLHLRAEALLLQAAQTLGADSFVPARRAALPSPVQTLITQAEACLQDAMTRWRDLRDPEVSESNFIHPDTGEAYNYRAADTYQVQQDLQGGLLTRYWQPAADPAPSEPAPLSDSEKLITKRFAVALSFPGEHRPFVAAIADALAQTLGQPKVFYDQFYEAELARPNLDTYLQRIYHDDADLICVFICEDYNHKDWCHLEARAIRDLIKQRRDDEIMFIRVDDGSVDGVFSVDGYVDAKDRPAAEVADLICQRLQMLPTGG
jgi:tetratricopeptide (TPR) repeat protein